VKHGQQLEICFPSYYQLPIDVTAGWVGFHLTAGTKVKFLAQGNNNINVAWLGIEPGTFQLPA